MFGKEKRELRAEIKELRGRLKELVRIQQERDNYKAACQEYLNTVKKQAAKIDQIQAESVKEKREQTDADLFLLCQQIQQKILAGENPTEIERHTLWSLQVQRNALAQQAQQGAFHNPHASGGLANIFGAGVAGVLR